LPHLKKAGWFWDTYYTQHGKESHLIQEQEGPPENVWLGVSTENQKEAEERIPFLITTPAAIRFLSCEPLLGPVTIPIDCADGSGLVDWVIVGGESGPGARPMNPEWVRSLRDQCSYANVPFFFKQWGNWKYSGGNCNKSNIGVWDGERKPTIGMDAGENDGVHVMINVGKSKAGRELDGKVYDQYPMVKE
jgi:protein gp37